jgi:glycerol kinase
MQRLADLLDAPVDRPMIQETTALGAVYLAGFAAGVYLEPTKFADNWWVAHRIKPAMSAATREVRKVPRDQTCEPSCQRVMETSRTQGFAPSS